MVGLRYAVLGEGIGKLLLEACLETASASVVVGETWAAQRPGEGCDPVREVKGNLAGSPVHHADLGAEVLPCLSPVHEAHLVE